MMRLQIQLVQLFMKTEPTRAIGPSLYALISKEQPMICKFSLLFFFSIPIRTMNQIFLLEIYERTCGP